MMVKKQNLKKIHLVGAQKTNYPWGFENRLIPAFRKEGYEVISTDFRQERENLKQLLMQQTDLVIICKGEGIPPELIRSIECPTVLWWAELLGTLQEVDEMAQQRRQMLAYNISAFDVVLVHDEASVSICQSLGAARVGFLPTAAVDPNVHGKIDVEKRYDIGFVGQLTPRRQALLSKLQQHFCVEIRSIWDPEALNKFFNETKIVLNIHLSKLPNTETRLCEVLGAGSFLLSEEISSKNLFLDGQHLAYWKRDNLEDLVSKIDYYLTHEEERERIADQGHQFALSHHTINHRVRQLMHMVHSESMKPSWDSNIIGVIYDANGNETDNIQLFYEAVCGKSDVGEALRWVNEQIPHSGWSVSRRALKLLMENLPGDMESVVEFGAGFSTLFLTKLFALRGKSIKMLSFEHQENFYNNLRGILSKFNHVKLIRPELKQLTDHEYETLFISEDGILNFRAMGSPVPKEQYHETRLHNVFYDIDLSQLIENHVDLFILDGPNGNGRSIVFPLVKKIVEPPYYFLVDDISHYPYLEEMSRLFKYEIIFEENFGHDAYCLVRVTDIK